MWYSIVASQEQAVQSMSGESNSPEKHGDANDQRSDSHVPIVSHSGNASVEEPKAEKSHTDTYNEVQLVIEKITFVINWFRTHWPGKPEVWIAWGTWLAVIAASIYAGIAAYQLCTMKDTEQRQLRAYLLADGGRVEFSKDGSYTVYVQFKNSGQTPAYTVVHWLTAEIQDDIADPFHELFESHKIKWRKTGPENVDLGSGQSMCIMLKGTSVTPSIPLGKAIYVWGDVKYKDVFQRECQFDAFLLKSTERLDAGRVLPSFMNWASDKNPNYKYKCDTSGKVILPPEKFDELPALPPEEIKSMIYVGECPKPESKPK
jgi:hypothetical protein